MSLERSLTRLFDAVSVMSSQRWWRSARSAPSVSPATSRRDAWEPAFLSRTRGQGLPDGWALALAGCVRNFPKGRCRRYMRWGRFAPHLRPSTAAMGGNQSGKQASSGRPAPRPPARRACALTGRDQRSRCRRRALRWPSDSRLDEFGQFVAFRDGQPAHV